MRPEWFPAHGEPALVPLLRQEVVVPYSTNSDLPPAVKKRLSSHQQDVFRAAFNNALKEYHGNESKAYAVAWSAAKKA